MPPLQHPLRCNETCSKGFITLYYESILELSSKLWFSNGISHIAPRIARLIKKNSAKMCGVVHNN